MQRSLRSRITMAAAIIGFALAMLLGGGAPHDFINGTATPTATPR